MAHPYLPTEGRDAAQAFNWLLVADIDLGAGRTPRRERIPMSLSTIQRETTAKLLSKNVFFWKIIVYL